MTADMLADVMEHSPDVQQFCNGLAIFPRDAVFAEVAKGYGGQPDGGPNAVELFAELASRC